jgi:P27 family predicted phage terminase small subunit
MTARASAQLKAIRGTSRPNRQPTGSAIKRLIEPPPPPEHLSESAKREWSSLAAITVKVGILGILTECDLRSLELLSESLALESDLRAALREEGLLIEGRTRVVEAHPAMRHLELLRGKCLRMLANFGLDPKSRSSVDMHPQNSESSFANNGRRGPLVRYIK